MAPKEGCDLILAFARTLFANGQATDQTVDAAEQLGRALGLPIKVTARWGELQLYSDSKSDSKDAILLSQVTADPAGVDMDRVAATMRAIQDVEAGRLAPNTAMEAINVISQAPP